MPNISFPQLVSGIRQIDRAFRIALGDILGNVIPYHRGLFLERQPGEGPQRTLACQEDLLNERGPILLAGLDYDGLWTRDSAINVWNGAGLLDSRLGRNTLVTVLEVADAPKPFDTVQDPAPVEGPLYRRREVDGEVRIAGQYWDTIIWTTGAWHEYLYTGNREFLALALEATCNSLTFFEATEFDPELNLFRGPACYGDGVAAYPDVYVHTEHGSSGILQWPTANPGKVSRPGYGMPMHALSTNCLYYEAYCLATRMAQELGVPGDPSWPARAEKLKESVNRHFWMPEAGRYRYLVDPFGGCDYQEGLGHAFAILFGIAGRDQAASILANVHVTRAGIPCLWPSFPRYQTPDEMSFGRHSGTVWPHVQGFWAEAAARQGDVAAFDFELIRLAEHACRDLQFAEIYHPITGVIYGGIQERGEDRRHQWRSCSRQTWSATAFLRMVLMGLFGMTFESDGVRFGPIVPARFHDVKLDNLLYRDMRLSVCIRGSGTRLEEFRLNGNRRDEAFLPLEGTGPQEIEIHVTD